MIRAAIDRLLDASLCLILGVMAAIVSASVFCRFALNSPLSWADELAQILLVWLTFLGAAVAVREDGHYYLNYLSRRAAGRGARVLQLTRDLAALAAIGVLLYFSARVTLGVTNWIMPATEISRSLVYGACPVGCVLMLYYALGHFVHHLGQSAAGGRGDVR